MTSLEDFDGAGDLTSAISGTNAQHSGGIVCRASRNNKQRRAIPLGNRNPLSAHKFVASFFGADGNFFFVPTFGRDDDSDTLRGRAAVTAQRPVEDGTEPERPVAEAFVCVASCVAGLDLSPGAIATGNNKR